MTNATKTLSIVFVVLAGITGLYSWLSETGTSEGLRTQLVEMNAEAIDKFVVENEGRGYPITLRKEESGWMVSSPQRDESYPASERAVTSAIDQLNDLNIKALVTRDEKKHARYQVDSTGTDVTLYHGDQQAAHVILGKPQFISRSEFNTYMRRADEPDVYSVEGFISASFNKDVDGWRDKQVWDFNRNDVQRIDLMFPADSSYSIKRVDQEKWVSNGDTLKSRSVDSMLNRLSSLSANGFVSDMNPEDFGNEMYAIQLQMSNGTQRTLRLKTDPDQKARYRAVANEFPYVFTVSKNTFDNSVLKGRGSLLK